MDLQVLYDERARTALVQEVHVFRRSDGQEVSSTALREVRVGDYSRARNIGVSAPIGDATISYPSNMPRLIYEARHDPTWERDADLWVSRVYRWAVIAGLKPAQEVTAALGVSARTATRRIARARQLGLLPPSDG